MLTLVKQTRLYCSVKVWNSNYLHHIFNKHFHFMYNQNAHPKWCKENSTQKWNITEHQCNSMTSPCQYDIIISILYESSYQYLMTSSYQYLITSSYQYLMTSSYQYLMTSRYQYLMTSPYQYLMTSPYQYLMTSSHQYLMTSSYQYLMTSPYQYLMASLIKLTTFSLDYISNSRGPHKRKAVKKKNKKL